MLTIQYKKIKDLIPYVNNSRTHSDAQVAQIASSIKEFGWTNPILLDGENGIIAGHGRLMAGQLLGHEEAPTIELSHLTEHQKKAYVIADNKMALNAEWDEEILKLEIQDLIEFNFDTNLTGFDLKSIDELLNNEQQLGLLPDEKLDTFLNGDTKILRLAYDEQEFETVVKCLQELQQVYGVEDFSTIVLTLVQEKCEK